MGRRRQTTAEMKLSGAAEKHPERLAARTDEPKPHGPLGSPPARFMRPSSSTAEHELTAWNELVEMAPPGVLTSADRWWCERAAFLMAKSRYSSLKAGEESRLADYLTKMACNPADRSKVNLVAGAGAAAAAAKRSEAGGNSANSGNTFKDIAQETAVVRPN